VLGVTQAGIGAQRAQERIVHHVLGLTVAGQPACVREQLVAVVLDQRPEGGQRDADHLRATRGARIM
jgi:hypothetical protein